MYVKVTKTKGRTYYYLAKSVWNKEKKRSEETVLRRLTEEEVEEYLKNGTIPTENIPKTPTENIVKVSSPKYTKRKEVENGYVSLNAEEVDRLKNACIKEREHLIINLLLNTGLKTSEILNLRREHISNEFIRIKDKAIPIPNSVYQMLLEWFEKNPIIVKNVRTIQRDIESVKERAGLDDKKLNAQILRNTFAFNFAREWGNPETLRKVMGFKNLVSVQVFFK